MTTAVSRLPVCLFAGLALALCLTLAGCSGDDDVSFGKNTPNADHGGNDSGGDTPGTEDPATPTMLCADDAPATAASSMDATTQSTGADGQTINVAMTVFTPALDEGECAPLIIKSHGFGGSRLASLDDVDDDDNAANVATRDAWRSGYYVIAFDQRGFGETGGTVMVENPDYEGRDTRAVVDYAEAQLGGHLAYRDGDPLVGALGLSYGGGFQLVGAGVDPRFDAIVPAATWYALPYSLNPNGVPKTVWLDLLVALGVSGAQGNLDPFLYEGFLQAQTGRISDDIVDQISGNGLNAFCEGPRNEGVPRVDVFLVQGVTDTLFNMNEAVRNARCLRAAGNDVRVLVQRTGHILPIFQNVMDAFGFDLDPEVQCGDTRYETSERMLSFLDEKLRGRMADPPVDANCIVQDDDHGIVADAIPVGGSRYPVEDTSFTTGPVVETVASVLNGLIANGDLLPTVADALGMTVDNLLGALQNLPTDPAQASSFLTNEVLSVLPPALLNELTAPAREIPLFTADRAMTLAGVPTADLALSAVGDQTGATDPIVFVGLGVRRAGDDTAVELINDQIAPLRGSGEYAQPLVGVSTRLQAGDTVYLMAYGFHNQYYLSFNKIPEAVQLSGSVDLPLLSD